MQEGGFSGQPQSPRKDTLAPKSPANRIFHGRPDRFKKTSNAWAFAPFDILPQSLPGLFAVVEYEVHAGQRVTRGFGFVPQQCASASTVVGVVPQYYFRLGEGLENHAVGVHGQLLVRFPDDFQRQGRQCFLKRKIGEMAFTRGRQASVKRYPECGRPGMVLAKPLRRSPGGKAVTARWTVADPIQLSQ